jgi:hypothetical protein
VDFYRKELFVIALICAIVHYIVEGKQTGTDFSFELRLNSVLTEGKRCYSAVNGPPNISV